MTLSTEQLYQQLASLSPQQRALFEQKLAEKGIAVPTSAPSIPRRSEADDAAIPLSFAQQRLWFMQRLDPNNTAYNVASVLQLTGPLDISALEKSLNGLVERHETLRTRFELGKNSLPQQIIDEAVFRPLKLIDLSQQAKPKVAAQDSIESLTRSPFDLAQSILRTALIQLADETHLLVLATHHIVSDRWSVGVFLRELTILYRAFSQGLESPLSPLPIQYGDWAIWQREQLQGNQLKTQTDYWTTQLAGELPLLDLPRDRNYGAVATFSGGQVSVETGLKTSQALKALANEHQVTLFTLLLAAFNVLLHRYTHSTDIFVGSDIANRDRTETEGLIGLLVNTLVFRNDLTGNPSFEDLLAQVRQTVLAGLKHQDLPFEKLVEVLNPERHLSQMMPLFQVKLDLQQANVKPLELDGLTLERYPLRETQAKYELRFNLQDTPAGITGQVEYNQDLFDVETIRRLVGHFQTLLAGIVTNPAAKLSALPLLSETELQTLLIDWNQTEREYPTSTIHELFEAQARKAPDAIALTDGEREWTYQALDQQANQVAYTLQQLGVGIDHRVGVCLPRTGRLIVSLLAILKAGGTYVPLDPAYPAERLRLIAEDAELSVLLTEGSVIAFTDTPALKVLDLGSWQPEKAEPVVVPRDPDRLAYLIYTSGSTGRPKGVAIAHRSTVAMLHWARDEFSSEQLAGVVAATSICFDLSIFEIFVPLSWGGRVVLVEDALALPKLSNEAEVTLINTVPSVLGQLLKVSDLATSVQTVNLAGEALPVSLVEQLRAIPQVQQIYNLYGPSEDTTYSTGIELSEYALDANAPVPIGKPIANTQTYVLDSYRQPVPLGVAGELYLGGQGLAQGYFQRSDLTETSFIDWTPPGQTIPARLYRTGDRVRHTADGNLIFLGRFDHQVKIRGFRIEIGEVENALQQHPAIQEAVAVAWGESEKTLVAYVVAQASAPTDWVEAVRRDLEEHLPGYLVPTVWMTLETLPQLPNGKIDRRSLPTPAVQTQDEYVAPRSALEATLAEIWSEVLSHAPVGIHDNFFASGGHSLLAIGIIAQAEGALNCTIPLRWLFQSPTIAGLAAQIAAASPEETRAETRAPLTADLANRFEPFPLTDIQQAYWLGRSQAFELGNISTHGYREIEVAGISVKQVQDALRQLILRHDMLRVVVNPDGQQQILESVPEYTVIQTQLSSAELSSPEHLALRDRLSHQVFVSEEWPLFEIEAAALPNGRTRFYVSFDVLIGDAWSFQLLAREMARLIRGETLTPITLSFRDYVVGEQAYRQTDSYLRARDYWQQRLDTLPPAPELPLAIAPSQIQSPRFERRSGNLSPQKWQAIKQRAHKAQLTPTGVVLAAFAEVLATWSRRKDFTLNLTLFNRQPLHPDVNLLVGDFTASLLLGIDHQGTDSFTQRAQRLQTQLWQDLDHRAVSGVEVLRKLAKQQNRSPGALMPVVFTSTLNQPIPATKNSDWQTETVYSVSQTSQVYLDHQVSEIAGSLVFNWDAITELFPANLLDEMFSAYGSFLVQLAETDAAWETFPRLAPVAQVAALNDSTSKVPTDLLHELFFAQVQQQPQNIAVITPNQTLTYQTLAQQVVTLAQTLRDPVQPNQLVAVSLEKGWQQVISVLSILSAGAAYVPIDPSLPQERKVQLLEATNASTVLTSAIAEELPATVTQIVVDEVVAQITPVTPTQLPWTPQQQVTDLAYVIYTSGSTGTPKGVMIDHRGAVNTVLDINQRFDVNSRDRIFALSSLSFDLSVYDIFGTLAAGAAIVIPDPAKAQDITHWRELLTSEQVTVWNSVPALMQLLLSDLANISVESPASLRLAMLSGDWIPLTLPAQFQQQFPAATLMSLGGATEASIWSISYPINTVDPSWHSIPYGRPLTNQTWYVLDDNLNPCPTWVPGQLYIGGVGLANGYWQQPELSADRFISSPLAVGETLYKTGDLGRYLPDGNLEFLGREDFQVKINGFRVELGEIETALQQYPAIKGAVVDAVGTPPELVAYVVPELSANSHQQPLAKLSLKESRSDFSHIEADETSIIALPQANHNPADYLRRQSHRQFLTQPIELSKFSELLAGLSAYQLPDSPLPKYRYASAGSLYPVRAYLHVRSERIQGLPAGWYFYHPEQHRLVTITPTRSNADIYGLHQTLHEDSAFSVFLIARTDGIAQVYGDQARDFCLLEAGYISQLLMQIAPELDLGLCPIGGFNPTGLTQLLNLDENHEALHGFIGGAIAAEWSKQWQAIANPPQTPSIAETLQQHLSQKLPRYLVPNRYQILDMLPLTPNGKVDRRALPAPIFDTAAAYIAPRTETETQITQLWATLLELEKVGIEDNFFTVGGNSLTAMQLLSQLRQTFGVELTIAQLFAAMTPAAQATLVEKSAPPESVTEQIQPAAARRDSSAVDVDALSDADVDDLLAQLLTDSQEVSS
ncbi:MAG: amino acid adenylation domain-containing protein [Cyanobacteria bacterium P01_H01_bin.15]